MQPFVTLCVDVWNERSQKLYMELGFSQLPPSNDDCPGRIQCVVSLSKLAASVKTLMERKRANYETRNGLLVPKQLLDYIRVAYSGPMLEAILHSGSGRRKWWQFSTTDFDSALAASDPACQVAAMLATTYAESFRGYIVEAVLAMAKDYPPAISYLAPGRLRISRANDVDEGVVRLFALDRLLQHENPRVLMTSEEWAKAQGTEEPTRNDLEQWEKTRFLVLFDRSLPPQPMAEQSERE